MKRWSIIAWCLIVVMFTGCRFSPGKSQEMVSNSVMETEKELPTSTITSEECYLCGSNQHGLWKYYEKQSSIIVLCLNTWSIGETRLFEYNDEGNIVDSSEHMTMTMDSHGEGECRWSFNSDPNRHTCDIELSYDEKSVLDPETLASQLCQACLDKVYDAIYDWDFEKDEKHYCDVLVDMATSEIYPISTNIVCYYIGDFWVHIDHDEDQMKDNVYIIYNPSK